MDLCRHFHILSGGRGRLHMNEQMGGLFITGFGHMHLVACPHRAAFDTQVRFWIIGRGNQDGSRRNVVVGAPVDLVFTHVKLLHPHPAQDLDGWDFAQPAGARLPLIAESRYQPSAPICSAMACRLVASLGKWYSSIRLS